MAGNGAGEPPSTIEDDDATEPPQRLDRQTIVLGLVVISGLIMVILDQTIVNVALDTLSGDFDTSLSTVQWVVTGYLLSLGLVIPLAGWAVDRFGAKRVWMVAIGMFVAGSALSGAAWSVESLIGFRVVQGLGGGMLMPVGQAILVTAAGPRRLGRVMAIIGVPMLLGPVFGPVLGGWLVEDVQWRWIFYVNVPVGALAVLLAAWLMPDSRTERTAGRLDLRGLLLLSSGLVGVLYGLSRANTGGGFTDTATLTLLIGGAVLVGLFAWYSTRRGDAALIDVRLFTDRTFAASSAAIFLIGFVLLGSLLLLPLYYQVVRGSGALEAGLLLAPQGIGAAIAMPLAGMLTDRIGARRVVIAGIVIAMVGTVAFTQVTEDTPYWLLGLSLVVRGFGLAATMMPTMSAAYTTLAPRAVPRASSTLTIGQQVGGSFGTAVLAVILSDEINGRLPVPQGQAGAEGGVGTVPEALRERFAPLLADAFGQTFWVALGMLVVVFVPVLLLPRRRPAAAEPGDGARVSHPVA